MFERLPASRRERRIRTIGASLTSVAAHALALFVFAAGAASVAQFDDSAFSGNLRFLLPPDRAASPPAAKIHYLGLALDAPSFAEGEGLPATLPPNNPPPVKTTTPAPDTAVQIPAVPQPDSADNAYSILEVDRVAERDPNSAGPAYPRDLLQKGVEGSARFRFVVDSTGVIDTSTVRLIAATHPAFEKAVLEAMPRMRYQPARMGPHPVRQLAEQSFTFRIDRLASPSTAKKP